jgi:leader peptidase (prepilin peptidase) / N-methyltransferase
MDPLFATSIFVLGLCFGSFLNVCIHRLPRRIELQDEAERAQADVARLRAEAAQESDIAARQADAERLEKEVAGFSVVQPHSACPKCHEPIRPYDNIPVVSWLMLGGKCRNCRTSISPRYIAVELLTGLLFLACYWQFGWTLATVKYCIFSFLILGLTFIDAEWQLLPDVMTLPGIVLGLVFSLFVPMADLMTALLWAWFPNIFSNGSGRVMSLTESALGALVGAAFFYFIAIAYKRIRGREGMGLGDVKLMGMVGAFLGVRLTVITIFGASLLGSIFGLATVLIVWNRRTERRMAKCHETREVARKRAWASAKLMYRYFGLPFGVFLGPMALVALFIGNAVFSFYWRIF